MAHPELPVQLANIVSESGSGEDYLGFVQRWGLIFTPVGTTNRWNAGAKAPVTGLYGNSEQLGRIEQFADLVYNAMQFIQHEAFDDVYDLLQPRLGGVQLGLRRFPAESSQEPATGLVRGWAFRTLGDAILAHVVSYATKEHRIAKCAECGLVFEQRDPREKFCPPDDYRGVGRKQSVCGARNRSRRARSKNASKDKE